MLELPHNHDIVGIPVTGFADVNHAVDCISNRIDRTEKSFVIAINPEKVLLGNENTELRQSMDRANVFICDGVGAAAALKILHGKSVKRVTGVSLFFELLAQAEQKKWGVFLLGAKEETNKAACEQLLLKYPNLVIAGRQNGYFDNDEDLIQQINKSQARLLFVAMGSPRQEIWIHRHIDQLSPSLLMGVGGSFDVASGQVKRAPMIAQKTGTEFLYRLIAQPSRWRRQVFRLPRFAFQVLKMRLSRRT